MLGPDSSLGPMIAATILPIVGSERRPRARRRARVDAGADGRGDHDRRRRRAARLRRRPALQADADRLHERPGADDPRRPAAEAVRVLGRRRRPDRRGARLRRRACVDGEAVGAARRGRPGQPRADPRRSAAWLPRIPGVLVAVVVAIAAAGALDLGDHGVSLVGTLPQGFPPLHAARARPSDLPLLRGRRRWASRSSRSTDTISTSSAFAARTGQEVDGNGEMIGIGAANVAAGFFQGFPVSTSGSRTAVAEQAGAKTQLTGRRRRGGDRADARARARAAAQPAAADAGRGRHRRVAVAGRHPGTVRLWRQRRDRVPAVDGGLPRRRAARRARGHRRRGGAVDPQRVPAGVVAVPDDARPRPGHGRPATTARCTPTPSSSRAS